MLLTAFTGVARAVPLELGYRVADLLSDGHRRLSLHRRRAVERNLQALRQNPKNPPEIVESVFRNYGRFVFELLRGPDVEGVTCAFQGRERLERALSRGRGVVLAAPHTGNWEIPASRLAAQGCRIHAVAGTQLTGRWTPELRRRQERAGIRILPPSFSSWRRLPRLLARNDVVCLLVDGDLYRNGTTVRFCERPVPFPTGPARLAARTGAALLPAFALRGMDGTLTARFLEEIPVEGEGKPAIRTATQALATELERVIRAHPEQWMIFRSFFPPEEAVS